MNILLSVIPFVAQLTTPHVDDHEHAHEAPIEVHGHEHVAGGSWIDEYFSLLTDPAHILFEITISILFDLLVVYVGYQLIVKRVIIPRLRKEIHKEIDAEHGIDHEDDTHEHSEIKS